MQTISFDNAGIIKPSAKMPVCVSLGVRFDVDSVADRFPVDCAIDGEDAVQVIDFVLEQFGSGGI
jgi:hypothetical protein